VKKYGCFTSDIAAMIREKIEDWRKIEELFGWRFGGFKKKPYLCAQYNK
jgi:hypothetical protein